jgi:hypothetical protein
MSDKVRRMTGMSNSRLNPRITGFLFMFAVLLFSGVLPADAQVSFFSNEALFNSSNPGLFFQDFNDGNVGPGGDALCNLPVDENSNDGCFDPGDILPGIAFSSSPLINGLVLVGPDFPPDFNVLLTADQPDTFEILFSDGNVLAAGVNLGCFSMGPCNSSVIVRVFGPGDDLIASTTVNGVTDSFDTFIGMRSTVPIARINLSAPVQVFEGVGSVSFGAPGAPAIPTLTEWGMIATSLVLAAAGFMALRRRRVIRTAGR